ncbi:unnamed protein product [Coregonus sp. 'balchen']|nr:unnamed protein product [Coregonus sp. 'balchen']
MPIEEVTIFWRYKDDRNVYNIVSGKADLTDEDCQFRDRTRMFPEEWANGNFSLLLTDLKDIDSGSYSCFIPTMNILRQVEFSVQGVLKLCVGAEALTETLVELGHNATLNCSLNGTNVHWYIQHQLQPPLAILRSFTSSSPAAFYYNHNFRQKYSLETGNRLLIQNVTVDENGVYYCAKKENDSLLFSNGTRFMTTVLRDTVGTPTGRTKARPHSLNYLLQSPVSKS